MSQLVIQLIHQVLVHNFHLPVELRYLIQQFVCVALTTTNIVLAIDMMNDPSCRREGLMLFGIFYYIPVNIEDQTRRYTDIVDFYLTSTPKCYFWKKTEVLDSKKKEFF